MVALYSLRQVLPQPGLDDPLGLRDGLEPVPVQALVPRAAVEWLEMRIVGRLAGPREGDLRPVQLRPLVQHAAAK
jgi:hypothetical protein